MEFGLTGDGYYFHVERANQGLSCLGNTQCTVVSAAAGEETEISA